VTNGRPGVVEHGAGDADEWVVRASKAFLPGKGFVVDAVVHVRGGTIAWVGDRAAAEAHSELAEVPTLTFDDATITPGLIDSHTHLTFSGGTRARDQVESESDLAQLSRAVGHAQHALAHGVTTLVDCGSRGLTTHALRDALADDLLAGPRILTAGQPITTTAGHCHWLGGSADRRDEVIRSARLRVAEGADFVKLMLTGGNMTAGSNPNALQYPPRTVAAVVSDMARLGRHLVAHAHSVDGVVVAARAGVRVIAHATCVSDDGRTPEKAALDLLANAGTFVDPTLTVGLPSHRASEDPAPPRHGRSRAQVREAMVPVFREMHARGVPLLAGTDGGSPGVPHHRSAASVQALHEEIGLTVEQALAAATDLPARAFGIREVTGAIEPGLSADLVVFGGDLSRDLGALQRPVAVWSRGRRTAAARELTGGRRCCTTSST
jgi:imidazolonepropionase-like amidohydrolase